MAKVDVLDWNKKKVGSAELNSDVFETAVRKDILHTIVKWQLARRRQGSHCAKTRGEVSGTGKKPYKQKGTGNARRGSERSPLIAGGGVHFAPKNRNYDYSVPKKVKQAGLRSALSYLHKEGRLFVVDAMTSDEGKTKEAAERFKKFGVKKAVLISGNNDDKFARATQNLKTFNYSTAAGLNVYDLLKFDAAILTQDSLESINKRCGVEA